MSERHKIYVVVEEINSYEVDVEGGSLEDAMEYARKFYRCFPEHPLEEEVIALETGEETLWKRENEY